MPLPEPQDVIAFWREAGETKWFDQDDGFDAAIRDRFLPHCDAAAQGELGGWEAAPDGALALVLLLDQFPRNLYRGTPRAYATDVAALAAAERALARGFEKSCDQKLAFFFYLPLIHAEDISRQERALAFFEQLGLPDNLRAARRHRDIIARFGRFPHRNAILGRVSTPEEQRYLDDGGFKG
jgi:uncharacterized protein (DUF924 family)